MVKGAAGGVEVVGGWGNQARELLWREGPTMRKAAGKMRLGRQGGLRLFS
jgi:hypothetical protein